YAGGKEAWIAWVAWGWKGCRWSIAWGLRGIEKFFEKKWHLTGTNRVSRDIYRLRNKLIFMARYFRFEDLEIWKEAIRIAIELFRIADYLETKKLWRFADQTRGVGMSIPNNISESTGTHMIGEQRQLLRVSRRECFEAGNILVILLLEKHITQEKKDNLYPRLARLSQKILNYSNSLKD
ncbi:MAG: four helix bundle protein, partial [Bacteroidota bacterium]|nr:four helix bundle protein [Bacteroidota bacterium]